MPRMLLPRDWERIDCSTFSVVITDLDELEYKAVIWDAHQYLSQTGPLSPILFEAEVRRIRPNIWIARFASIRPSSNCVIGIVHKERSGEPVVVGGIRFGVSDQTNILRTAVADEKSNDILRYPVPVLWNRMSNFHMGTEIPVVDAHGSSPQGHPRQLGPTTAKLYGREVQDARSRLLLQYCLGVESNAFRYELGRTSWQSEAGYTATFADAELYTRQGVIVDRSGVWGDTSFAALVGEDRLTSYPDMFDLDGQIGRVERGTNVPLLEGTSLVIGNAGHGNFAHWMMNAYLAAFLLRGEILETDLRLICPPVPGFARESLRLLGLWDRVTEIDEPHVRAERLIYPSPLSTHANMYPPGVVVDMVKDLKQRAKQQAGFWNIDAPEFIYLTRQGFPSTRNMRNENDLIGRLKTLGFTTIATHDLSFVERVRVFSEAKIVIGQLGAALSHVLFLPKNSLFVEITTEDWHSNEYLYLAKLLQIWCVRFMVAVNPEDFIKRGVFSFDVPIEDVIKTIADIQKDFGTWIDPTLVTAT